MRHEFLLLAHEVAYDDVLVPHGEGGLRQVLSIVVHLHLSNLLLEIGPCAPHLQCLHEHGLSLLLRLVPSPLSHIIFANGRVFVEEDLGVETTYWDKAVDFSHCFEVVEEPVFLVVEYLD